MKIDGENGETQRYNNSAAMFNSYMMEFRKYYNKTHMPLSIRKKDAPTQGKKPSFGMSEAEYEKLKREIIALLSEEVARATAPDKIYDVVMSYVRNNTELLKGRDGKDGMDGKDGYTPRKGVDYFDGEKGEPFRYGDFTPEQLDALKGDKGDKGAKGDQGERGVEGPQGMKGDKGEKGDRGEQGPRGFKGDKGDQGEKGDAGYTPQLGTDYWTQEQKETIKRYYANELADKQPLDFVVNVTTTGSNYETVIESTDKTFEEVLEAHNAGKRVYLLVNKKEIAPMTGIDTSR
ncbi:MAG: collagen-like protein, partial [Clostridia bacterium]|nr:collagen-like protein [Clostridia bacterium]